MVLAGAASSLPALGFYAQSRQLVPDTWLYARRTYSLWPSPLADAVGYAGGVHGVVALSAAGIAGCVLLIGWGRGWSGIGAVAAFLGCPLLWRWTLYPGADFAGVALVLLAARRRSWRWPAIVLAGLIHPVAGLCGVGLLPRKPVIWLPLAIGLTQVHRWAVFHLPDTTARYLLPGAAVVALELASRSIAWRSSGATVPA